MPGPLDGIAVVDLTSYIAGSYAGMMLADMGARVTKVEALAGDSFRELPGFYGWNRGKRSIAVDLKTPAGCQIVEELAERSDVFMENMRPGVADRLGGQPLDDVAAVRRLEVDGEGALAAVPAGKAG